MSEGARREAVIEKIVEGGVGLAHDQGKTLFLPLTAPGERVRYEPVREHGDRVEARVLEILAPSAARIEPPCPVYGVCGGCQIQHLSAAVQLDAKRAVALETLARLGRVEAPDPVEIVPSPAAFAYRHRATFHLDWRGSLPVAGFHRSRSHDVVDIASCPLLSEALNSVFASVRRSLLPALRAHRPERLQIVCGEDDRHEIAMTGDTSPTPDEAAALAAIARTQPGLRAVHWETPQGRHDTLIEKGPPLSYRVPDAAGGERDVFFSARVFTQANLALNRLLVGAILAATEGLARVRLLDLHSGCGNLSIPILPRASEAHLVDTNPLALAHAERGTVGFDGRLSVTMGRAEDVAARLTASGARFDLVLLDPPRQGAAGVVRPLAAAGVPRILYVSCNVPTLARDLSLFQRAGYRLDRLRLFDGYPQTAHVEALADLRRE